MVHVRIREYYSGYEYRFIFQNLTEFNTAHNRRVTSMGDIGEAVANPLKRKRKSIHVHFNEDEEVINPGKRSQCILINPRGTVLIEIKYTFHFNSIPAFYLPAFVFSER